MQEFLKISFPKEENKGMSFVQILCNRVHHVKTKYIKINIKIDCCFVQFFFLLFVSIYKIYEFFVNFIFDLYIFVQVLPQNPRIVKGLFFCTGTLLLYLVCNAL